MGNGDWYKRLIEAIDADPRSDNKISIDARLGRNYVSQIRKKRANAGVDSVLALCSELGLSATYLFTGANLSRDAEEFLEDTARLSEESKEMIRTLVSRLERLDEPPV